MKQLRNILLLFSMAMFFSLSHAASEEQLSAIKQLGGANGIALNCGYIGETRRMKRALVTILPKIRILGEAFDQSTNDSFLGMIRTGDPCPAESQLSREVDAGIEHLEALFLAPQPPHGSQPTLFNKQQQ